MKRKLRRRAAKTVMKKLKADELQMKINKIYVQSSDNSSEVSSNEENLVLSDIADECYCDVPEESNNSDMTSVQVEQIAEHIVSDLQNELNESPQSDGSEVENENAMVFRNVAQIEQFVIESLRAWTSESGVLSMLKVDNLLKRLSVGFPNISKSYKTLLKSNINPEINICQNGEEFWYKGIRTNLDQMLLQDYLQVHRKIVIDINIDGLPLFKSSKLKFWPILASCWDSK